MKYDLSIMANETINSGAEQVQTPEKSRDQLYVEALRLKRDVLSAHYAMNSLRYEIGDPEQIKDEQFAGNPKVVEYKTVREEYRRRKDAFLASLGSLSEEDKESISQLTRLSKVELALASFGPIQQQESQQSEQQSQPPAEQPKDLTPKERQAAETDPTKMPPKGFMERVKASFDRARGIGPIEQSRMTPLGLEDRPQSVEQPEAPQASPENKGSKQWTALGWLAERGKGILSAGIWEVRQAWRFQRGTKIAANDLEALSTSLNIENADEAQEKANEMLRMMKENNITTVMASEFVDIAKKVTYEKAAENNERIDYIVKNALDELKERVAKYRGQATAETVLTPENLKAVEADLRMELNKFRDGATIEDVKGFAKVMRDNMDKYWWLRYVYAPLEASLLGYLGYHYLPWSRWLSGSDLIPGGEDINLSPDDAGQRYMNHNLWEESREHLKELGVDNPSNEEIQAVDSAAAQENNIRVVNPETNQTLWPETAGGHTKDISMMKGLIKWSSAHKAALAIKAARLGVKAVTGF